MNLKPVTFKHIKFWGGTYKTFGTKALLTLMSPLLNTILNWKYRNMHLEIDDAFFPFRNGDEFSQPRVIERDVK